MQDQTFPITEQPVADSVTITVLSVDSTTNNGFKEIYFDGKEGKGFFLQWPLDFKKATETVNSSYL